MPDTSARRTSTDRDVVYTPAHVARDMVEWFRPAGVVLDPCRGRGAFHDLLPDGSPWCELSDGVDFFAWTQKVDWVISNPPYSITRAWFRHSYTIADNICYLLPLRNITGANGAMVEIFEYGGIKHIRRYGTGNSIGFPMGNGIVAIHLQRDYRGPTSWSEYKRKEGATEMLPTIKRGA